MPFSVYILKCADGTLYAGSTNDIKRRLRQHNHLKSGARYTKARRPVRLIYTQTCASIGKALRLEHQIKILTREQKLDLIRDFRRKKSATEKTTKRKNRLKKASLL